MLETVALLRLRALVATHYDRQESFEGHHEHEKKGPTRLLNYYFSGLHLKDISFILHSIALSGLNEERFGRTINNAFRKGRLV